MCGIVGIVGNIETTVDQKLLHQMTQSLFHRGPDDEGYYINQEVGLGMRRLAIIDLENGKQPLSSADGNYTIIFNGEIYNYQLIRKQLMEKGSIFKTNSDTEVILMAYLAYGIKALDLFNGMFAFAIWDKLKKTLLLVRDRLGVKPLYYISLPDGTLLFASEMKAFLHHPHFSFNCNLKAIDHLLTFGFPLCPETFIKGIYSVLPGHYLWVTPQKIEQHQYWDLDFTKPKLTGSTKVIVEELDALFHDSVKQRLVADVPVAAYLSGGIDSSSVVQAYSKAKGAIATFSIGFQSAKDNELSFAQLVADTFQTKHTAFDCQIKSSDLHKFIWHLEEPLMTLLHLPLFYLSQAVHQAGFKVVLSGDGADELFGGYDYLKLMKLFLWIKKTPHSRHRKRLLQILNPQLKNDQDCHNYYLNLLQQWQLLPPSCSYIPYILQQFPYKQQLFSKELYDQLSLETELDLFFNPDQLQHLAPLDQMFYIESKFRLLNLTLPLSDKMSMANSVENRSPFLDYRLAELSTQIPNHLKIFGLKEKFCLKKMMRHQLPQTILQRKKQPLTAPLDWFLTCLGEELDYYLSDTVIRQKGYFNPDYLQFIKKEYDQKFNLDYSSILLMVYFIHLWDDLFLKKKC